MGFRAFFGYQHGSQPFVLIDKGQALFRAEKHQGSGYGIGLFRRRSYYRGADRPLGGTPIFRKKKVKVFLLLVEINEVTA
jgi:hypothetical protein